MKTLTTMDQVIKAFGGWDAFKTFCGGARTAWNWRNSQAFPARAYVAIQAALALRGCRAAPELFPKMMRVRTEDQEIRTEILPRLHPMDSKYRREIARYIKLMRRLYAVHRATRIYIDMSDATNAASAE